jgi:hypothetical protein
VGVCELGTLSYRRGVGDLHAWVICSRNKIDVTLSTWSLSLNKELEEVSTPTLGATSVSRENVAAE